LPKSNYGSGESEELLEEPVKLAEFERALIEERVRGGLRNALRVRGLRPFDSRRTAHGRSLVFRIFGVLPAWKRVNRRF
jgi:hypothetical protein